MLDTGGEMSRSNGRVLPEYRVRRIVTVPRLEASENDPAWMEAEEVSVNAFRPEGSTHRPTVKVQLAYDERWIYGIFCTADRYVRSVQTQYQSAVCTDSCVEFFVQPKDGCGYFNFEFNAGGALHCSHILDPTRTATGFKSFRMLTAEDGHLVKVRSTLPLVVEPEIAVDVVWRLEFHIPIELLEKYVGPLGDLRGQVWRGNFYKCGDRTSHPHWAAWAPVDELNFHLPRCFGCLFFV